MERTEVEVPSGVEVASKDMTVTVKGPKGTLEKTFNYPRFGHTISITPGDGKVLVSTDSEKRQAHAMVGTIQAHLRNMFRGVTDGYHYELKIVYTHFPITATVKDGVVEVKNFLGEKGIRTAAIAGDCKVSVEKEFITVSGTNREDVGQTAANLERSCKLRGRDRRIFQDGIYLTAKKLQSGKEL